MIAALNHLDVYAVNIGNAYFNTPCWKNIWTVSGTDFGSDNGSVMLVIGALYGLKIGGSSWRSMLAETLGKYGLGYTASKYDKDVWIKCDFYQMERRTTL